MLISTPQAFRTNGLWSSLLVSLSATEKTSPSLLTSDKRPVEALVSLDWLVWMHAVAVEEFGADEEMLRGRLGYRFVVVRCGGECRQGGLQQLGF